ncbi:MAG TPA: tetratricopeptide repeat protein [Polyangiaceae bacterium]
MFKVECPGCKAPYQVDERRIPSSGLKMRCPKCGTSFKVDPPNDGRSTGPSAAVLGGALGVGSEGESAPPPALAAPRASVDLKGTIVGVAPAGGPPPRPAIPANLKGTMMGVAPAAGAAPPVPPPRPAVNLKGTMLGVAPAPAPAAPAARPPAAAAAAPPAAALPAVGFGKPPPMPARRGPEVKPAEPDPFDDPDLPAAVGSAPDARGRALSDSNLPAPRAPQPFADLPAAPGALSFDDLPVAAGARPATQAPLDLALDLDLPSPGGRVAAPAPARSAALSSTSSSGLDLDLPTVGERSPYGAGLPSVSARASSPPFGSASLPSPARGAAPGAMDLPTPSRRTEVGLPTLSAGLPEVRASVPARGNIELPSLGGRGRPSSAGLELDDGLPLVGNNLPALGGVGLPERQAGLPALGGSLPSYSATGLPTPSASLPVRGGGGSLPPALGRGSLPPVLGPGSLPPALGGGQPSAPPIPVDDVFELDQVPSLPPDFGLEGARGPAVSAPPAGRLLRAASGEFGDLELPLGGSPSLSPHSAAGFGEEADLFGAAPARPPVSAGQPARAPLDPAIVRQSGGGTAYGEVNLGDEGGEAEMPIEAAPAPARRDEDMEFGAIPQEDQPRAVAGGPTHVSMPVGRAAGEVLPPKRKSRLQMYVGLFVVCVGGAALALVPTVGPFGAYVIIDHLKAGDYAELVTNTVATVRADLANDTYPAAKQALAAVEVARASAKRVRPLPAYAAFAAYSEELRFGSDSEVHARASVLLAELAEHADTAYVALARCAQAAAEGQIARAKQLFDSLPQSPNDPDQAILRGEIALRAGDPKAAALAWEQAVAAQKNARSVYGLARANYAAGNTTAAAAAAHDALAQNPNHVGARILLARISGATRSGEAEALRLLGSVTKDANLASPDEVVSAQTLLGDIHLARSRMSQAEAAYSEALKINPKAARALNGLGDALYRAGRYSEAQARFEASTQADPDDLSAKIGVAKSKLALERVEDASVMLKKLRDTYPQAVPVAYWYGRALEASGNRAQAEIVYRDALKGATDDPQAVDVYIGLALLQSQQGRNDEAQKTLADARAKLPDQPAIHKALGDVALSQGRYPQATAEFRQAVAMDSEDLGAKFKLGVALRRDTKFDEASKSFDEVGAVDKDYPGLALERGVLYEASGRTDEALKEYEGALAKAPKDPDLMLRVGCGKVSANRPKDAEELLRKVLADRPNSAETNHCLGRALLIEGTRLAEALRLLERAVELDANRAEYQLYAGWAANEAGNVPKAEKALAEALRLDQGLADAYWQRGVLRQRQGAVRDAIADLTKALALRPSRNEAHASLADAYYDLGREQEAMKEWQLAIQAQPDNATWRFRYGKLLAANHQNEGAVEQLTKALGLVESVEPPPRWSWEAHHALARALGPSPEAAKHWEQFLRLGPRDSPYRAEAKAFLERAGRPWVGE